MIKAPSPLKAGIIGLGKMGWLHSGIINALPDSIVVAMAERESILTRLGKKLLPNVRFYQSVKDMIVHEELDFVYVTTPISSHPQIMDEVVASNKNLGVFMEKPLAGNLRDARKIESLSASAGFLSMVGFQKRFSPIFQRGREALQQGAIGKMKVFKASSYVSGVSTAGTGWRFKKGQGGALLDLGPHLIDALLWYFGDFKLVEGGVRSVFSKEVDDEAHAEVQADYGVVGTFDVSWSVEGYRLPELRIEASGDNGKLVVTDDYLAMNLISDTGTFRAGVHHYSKPEFGMNVEFLLGDPEYCLEDLYFINCLAGKRSPRPDFHDAAKVNKVISLIQG